MAGCMNAPAARHVDAEARTPAASVWSHAPSDWSAAKLVPDESQAVLQRRQALVGDVVGLIGPVDSVFASTTIRKCGRIGAKAAGRKDSLPRRRRSLPAVITGAANVTVAPSRT